MQVTVSDQGIPKRSAQTILQVNVRRNQFSPVFKSSNYSVVVDSLEESGKVIITVDATDQDANLQPNVGFISSINFCITCIIISLSMYHLSIK